MRVPEQNRSSSSTLPDDVSKIGVEMIVPEVNGYGGSGIESFEEYFARWPLELGNFPRDVVENWVYRHWQDFGRHWLDRDLSRFEFHLVELTNSEVMGIGHIKDWMQTLDYWGDELFRCASRSATWLAKSMLDYGTSPAPIIVAPQASGMYHPAGEPMHGTQLIEGHLRLAYLRGMIRHNHSSLQERHEVWAVCLPRDSFELPGLQAGGS
ncbi:hypothetical protein LMG19145_03028 [Xanthomonas arboricola pv. fragariae]|nr:hypothetical protein LMG19145_03028 [Xanthomonas arboricola pv. fragariae]